MSRTLFWVAQAKQTKLKVSFSRLRWNGHIPRVQIFFQFFSKKISKIFFSILLLIQIVYINLFSTFFFTNWFKKNIIHGSEYGFFNWNRKYRMLHGRKLSDSHRVYSYTKLHKITLFPDFSWKGRIGDIAFGRYVNWPSRRIAKKRWPKFFSRILFAYRRIFSITSILRKIQNPIKFEPFFRFRPNLRTKLSRFYLQL